MGGAIAPLAPPPRRSATASHPYPGGRAAISKAFMIRKTPQAALDIVLASLAPATFRQYSCSLKRWWKFCEKKGLSPFQGSIQDIMEFLAEQLNQGSSYGTLNSHRSALSLIMGQWVGTDELIKSMFKGIFRLNPTQPKYDSTWDPQIVLRLVADWYPHDKTSLEELTLKLATVLALATAHRVQTLAFIQIGNINKL